MIQPTSLVARALDGAPLALDHFPAAGGASAPNVPILLVHGYAQNRWTFHHPSRSLAEHLAGRGHDTFVAELRGHGRSRALGAPLPRGVRDYLDLDLPGILGELRSRTGAARGLLLGHSLGGLLCLLLAGSRPEEVAGVCAISAPSRRLGASRLFRNPALRGAAALAATLRERGLDVAARRLLPAFPLDALGLLAFGFERRVWRRLPAALRRGRRSPLTPVRPWREGSFEPAMERDRLVYGFDRTGMGVVGDLLEWGVRGRLAPAAGEADLCRRLEEVRGPVLLLASPDDETVRERWTVQPSDLPAGAVAARSLPGFGHCDLILGTRAPVEIWPVIDAWIASIQ